MFKRGLQTSEEQIAVIIRDNVSLRFKNDSLKRERKKKNTTFPWSSNISAGIRTLKKRVGMF